MKNINLLRVFLFYKSLCISISEQEKTILPKVKYDFVKIKYYCKIAL